MRSILLGGVAALALSFAASAQNAADTASPPANAPAAQTNTTAAPAATTPSNTTAAATTGASGAFITQQQVGQVRAPKLVGVSGGRTRTFFVNKELASIDDMLAGVMRYTKGTASPLHYHEVCEHFYFIMEGNAQVETPDGVQPVGPGTMVFIPAEQRHRLRALTPLFYFEFQAPNRFKTHILEGTDDDLRWNRVDGGVWVQS